MYTKIYWLHQLENNAQLGISARPRGGEWLQGEIIHYKRSNIGMVIVLLEKEEITALSLRQQEKHCVDNGIVYTNFPIPDRSVPTDNPAVNKLINAAIQLLQHGKSVLIHCRMGIGRSAIIAGAVLMKITKSNATDILQHITQVRGLEVPDTSAQIKWLQNRE
ncbi:dual specificity protein phosphatase family protein [Chitinophaga sp. Cy-1792]|uniref:protein-tyrosine phosphatase family protein n=1 Tax=Chitinophaga sp. Cy-1792 TaxID=2608339 RepID=UPI001420E4FE|nr:dual specificity protein phosphatase family protein [Chitinophaga sp. Cy-1792]NIG54090.1 protein tyrosine phosphatase [Chitinophaga sp. Cy-1792]